MDFTSPLPRGGHTSFCLDHKFFVFGGLAYTVRGVTDCPIFKPYASHIESIGDHGTLVSDVFTYDFTRCIWQKAVTVGDGPPEPRMFHLTVCLDHKRAFIFGGRGTDGRCLNDAWIFHAPEYRWERVPDTLPIPPARFSSAATVMNNGQVAMFGGRDFETAMGDLWLWDPKARRWASPLTVGVPPGARHGHALLTVSEGKVLVIGGCGVGPNQELAHPPHKEMADLEVGASRIGEGREGRKTDLTPPPRFTEGPGLVTSEADVTYRGCGGGGGPCFGS